QKSYTIAGAPSPSPSARAWHGAIRHATTAKRRKMRFVISICRGTPCILKCPGHDSGYHPHQMLAAERRIASKSQGRNDRLRLCCKLAATVRLRGEVCQAIQVA